MGNGCVAFRQFWNPTARLDRAFDFYSTATNKSFVGKPGGELWASKTPDLAAVIQRGFWAGCQDEVFGRVAVHLPGFSQPG